MLDRKYFYANGSEVEPYGVSFYDYDTEENHKANLLDRQDELDAQGWAIAPNGEYWHNPHNIEKSDTVNVRYRINEHGFRGVPFPIEETPRTVIALGCSITLGIGMPESLAWPTLVASTLQYRSINLAKTAATLDDCFKHLIAWLPKLKSEWVFCLEPMMHEAVDPDYVINREKNILAMKQLCGRFGSKFYMLPHNWQDTATTELIMTNDKLDKARDLMSPGRKQHAYISYLMLKHVGIHP